MKRNHESPAVVGITTYGRNDRGRFHLPGEYIDAVRLAGGIPLLLPPGERRLADMLQRLDAVILAGGGDIDPAYFGAESHPAVVNVDTERDATELRLAKELLELHMPVLGICRGMQLLNVATGGDLVLHIPDRYGNRVEHRTQDGGLAEHSIEIEPGSKLAKIFRVQETFVNSMHHQAVGVVPGVWKVTATAPDGSVEAMEHTSHPWMVAVQWHPEMASQQGPDGNLFRALVAAAADRKRRAAALPAAQVGAQFSPE